MGDAWVELAPEEESRPPDGHPYNFGFVPSMSRLLMAHGRIGKAFRHLFTEIMFSPEGSLTRQEREMAAAVAAVAQDCFY
jgi:hypothetical protein